MDKNVHQQAKKSSARSRGLDYQRWIKIWLEEREWVVHNQPMAGKMIFVKGKKIYVSQKNDIFGCFDLIAKKNGETLWIQGTTDTSLKRKVDKIIEKNLTFNSQEFPMIFIKRDSITNDVYGFDEIGNIVHPGKPALYGKIIRRKFYVAEGINFDFGEVKS